jgi:hypothetical protein
VRHNRAVVVLDHGVDDALDGSRLQFALAPCQTGTASMTSSALFIMAFG